MALSSAFVPLNTTTDFATYRIEAFNGSGFLYVNDGLVASLPLGNVYPDVENMVLFGSNSTKTSQTELKYVRYGNVAAVPEAGTFALFGAAFVPVAVAVVRRRRRVA